MTSQKKISPEMLPEILLGLLLLPLALLQEIWDRVSTSKDEEG